MNATRLSNLVCARDRGATNHEPDSKVFIAVTARSLVLHREEANTVSNSLKVQGGQEEEQGT